MENYGIWQMSQGCRKIIFMVMLKGKYMNLNNFEINVPSLSLSK